MQQLAEVEHLLALSPLDGRYCKGVRLLRDTFSEFALIKHRILVEVEWLHFIMTDSSLEATSHPPRPEPSDIEFVLACKNVSHEDALLVKAIETETGHDVKAVEYFLQRRIEEALQKGTVTEALRPWKEWVHFGCTSEDINNLAYGLMVKEAVKTVLCSRIVTLMGTFADIAKQHKGVSMLARTHGQPATPTTFGKEMALFAHRLSVQLVRLQQIPCLGKFNGAVGNLNAHRVAFPNVDWPCVASTFVTSLGLKHNAFSTQIEPHDYIAEICHGLIRIHTILLDAVQDLWQYISRDYLKLRKLENEVGSSTMPHKVNPIDFENAEGNLGLANALLQFFALKLPVSRLQRDLSDSTVLRNLGTAFGYSLLAMNSISKGLSKIDVNIEQLQLDLAQHWEVLGEPLQTCLRSESVPHAYEAIKAATRGAGNLSQSAYAELLSGMTPHLSETTSATLRNLTPQTYIGYAIEYVDLITREIDRYREKQTPSSC